MSTTDQAKKGRVTKAMLATELQAAVNRVRELEEEKQAVAATNGELAGSSAKAQAELAQTQLERLALEDKVKDLERELSLRATRLSLREEKIKELDNWWGKAADRNRRYEKRIEQLTETIKQMALENQCL